MTDEATPGMAGVVDGLMAELRQINGWIVEVTADLKASQERRVRVANALDSALAVLDRPLQQHYEREILALLGDVGPTSTGRPVSDDRQERILQYLADWPEQEITVAEIRIHLDRTRCPSSRNYVSNLLKKFEKRGFVMRTGHGRYRVTRLHPTLFARRHGLLSEMREKVSPELRHRMRTL